jgi:Uma2 family endonuclease
MIATIQDLLVLTESDFDRLPAEGRFEVADGRAILLPPNDYAHQNLSDVLVASIRTKLRSLGHGHVVSAVNVLIPPSPGSPGKVQNRVPDVVVSTRKPDRRFNAGNPPELVIEILSTPRGNVERNEKMDDYARAGIGEYWIVDPFRRVFEVCLLRDGEYALQPGDPSGYLRPRAFAGLEIDPQEIWTALD